MRTVRARVGGTRYRGTAVLDGGGYFHKHLEVVIVSH